MPTFIILHTHTNINVIRAGRNMYVIIKRLKVSDLTSLVGYKIAQQTYGTLSFIGNITKLYEIALH